MRRQSRCGWFSMGKGAVIAVCCAMMAGTSHGQDLKPGTNDCAIAELLARTLPREHLMHAALNDDVARQAWDNYLSALDPRRLFFLEADIAEFKTRQLTLDDELAQGDVSFAYEVFNRFRERVEDRGAYLEGIVEAGLDLDKDETYRWDRSDAPWPRDQAEWDELWRKTAKDRAIRGFIDTRSASTNDGPAEVESPAPAPLAFKRFEQFREAVQRRDSESVLEQYLGAFTTAYDPHCHYMLPASADNFAVRMSLSLVGIGAMLRIEDGEAEVVSIVPGGPAARDRREIRLVPGDRIVAVGQGTDPPVDILHWPLRKIVGLIRGTKGSTVVLSVIPASDASGLTTKQVDLVRDAVRIEEGGAEHDIQQVTGADGQTRNIGVITLPSFYGKTTEGEGGDKRGRSASEDVQTILESMATNDVEGVLLDLRGNGGGSLLEAVRMTGLFIDSGPVVQVRRREGIAILADRDGARTYAGPLVVLVNRHTASASEIVAGALQDYGCAIVVGDSKTHGKGTVQTVQAMGDAATRMGSIKVTNALFYRISGSSTQLKGVTPDIVLPSRSDTMEVGEDYLKNPMAWTMVRPARFRLLGDSYETVPVLTQQSEKRRSEDQRFVTYTNLLARVAAIDDRKILPLNIDQRNKLAQTRKKLYDIRQEFAEGSGDVVLRESLHIVADLVALQQGE